MYTTHYRTQDICRVSEAYGNAPRAHGKWYAVSNPRHKAHGKISDGIPTLCRELGKNLPTLAHGKVCLQ
jgi:hypothetical protein